MKKQYTKPLIAPAVLEENDVITASPAVADDIGIDGADPTMKEWWNFGRM